jgi:predicted DNA-binding transcriptional regulator YafY
MTPRRFDALASSTPARRFVLRLRKSIKAKALRCIRLLSLAALVDPKNAESLADYRLRFRVSAYTYYRDRRALRRAGLYTYAFLYGRYRLMWHLDAPECD